MRYNQKREDGYENYKTDDGCIVRAINPFYKEPTKDTQTDGLEAFNTIATELSLEH